MCLTILIIGALTATFFSFVIVPAIVFAGGVYFLFSFVGDELKAMWRRYRQYVNRTYFPDSPLFKMTSETADAVIFTTARLLHPLTHVNIGGYSVLGDSVPKPIPNRGRTNTDMHTGISSQQNSTIGG